MNSFGAAIFDLDGTLLDSLDLWKNIDAEFFAGRGLVCPLDYGTAISGLSPLETAVYTKERFGFKESPEEINAIWLKMSRDAYRYTIPLKSGAGEYLKVLKERGIKLAVATALDEMTFTPALRRLGIYDMFDAFTSLYDCDSKKESGEIYRLAASKLLSLPNDCAVFEDIPQGILGAQRQGMRAYLVYDKRNAALLRACPVRPDGVIYDFNSLLKG